MNGTEKVPAIITDFKEYHTDTTVRFVVKMSEEKLREAEHAGLHKVFKLQTPLTCNSMVRGRHSTPLPELQQVATSSAPSGNAEVFLGDFKNICLFFCFLNTRSCLTMWAV